MLDVAAGFARTGLNTVGLSDVAARGGPSPKPGKTSKDVFSADMHAPAGVTGLDHSENLLGGSGTVFAIRTTDSLDKRLTRPEYVAGHVTARPFCLSLQNRSGPPACTTPELSQTHQPWVAADVPQTILSIPVLELPRAVCPR